MAKCVRGCARLPVLRAYVAMAAALATLPAAAAAEKADGFSAPEPRKLPGFELVQNAVAAWPVSATAKSATPEMISKTTLKSAPASVSPVIAGRYAILREDDRMTGCVLTLEDAGNADSGKAVLAPACSDRGIILFDPTTWKIVDGRLALTARRGYQTQLERQADGLWKRYSEDGNELILRKM